MRKIRLPILGILLLALGMSCATSSAKRTPLEDAKLAYADAAIAYQAGIAAAEDLRANHQLNDAQFVQIVKAAGAIHSTAPMVRDAIRLWESSGVKPANYDALIATIKSAVVLIEGIIAEVKK